VVMELLGKIARPALSCGASGLRRHWPAPATTTANWPTGLTIPATRCPATYRVTVAGEVSKETVRRLSAGVDLDGRFVYPEVQVNKREPEKTVLEITVHEGRYT